MHAARLGVHVARAACAPRDAAPDHTPTLSLNTHTHTEHFVDDLEMELVDALLDDFQLEAEDGSPRQVAASLIALYQACCRNDAGPLQQLRQRQAAGGAATAASRAAAAAQVRECL